MKGLKGDPRTVPLPALELTSFTSRELQITSVLIRLPRAGRETRGGGEQGFAIFFYRLKQILGHSPVTSDSAIRHDVVKIYI